MKTLSYIYGVEEEIEIGNTYYFGQLWDGYGDGVELLESGVIAIDDSIVEFKIIEDTNILESISKFKTIEEDNKILESVVEVTGIY